MYLKAINKVKILTVASIFNTFFTCLLNIILLLFLKKGITGYLIANILGTAITISFMFFSGGIYKISNKKTPILF